MTNSADFIGRGIMFPMRVDQTGAIALSSGVDDLGTSIHMVLATAPGERLMRPDFGCKIWELMFEPINANTIGLMKAAVLDALGRWEPRIAVEDVDVAPDGVQDGMVNIDIHYRVKVTNDRRNLVYPFYVIPKEDEE